MISFALQKFSDPKLEIRYRLNYFPRASDVNFWVYFQHFLLKMMVSKGFHENTVYFTIGFPIVMEIIQKSDSPYAKEVN